jgi:hypothetical protein
VTIAPGVGGSANWHRTIHWGVTAFVQNCNPVYSLEQATDVTQVKPSNNGRGGETGTVWGGDFVGGLCVFGSGPARTATQQQLINNGNDNADFIVQFSSAKQPRV